MCVKSPLGAKKNLLVDIRLKYTFSGPLNQCELEPHLTGMNAVILLILRPPFTQWGTLASVYGNSSS